MSFPKRKKFEPFSARRKKLVLVTLIACLAMCFGLFVLQQNLRHSSHWSGYVLIASLFFLAAFNLRKKLPFLPMLGSAAMWMQVHIYVALSTFLMFGFHVAWKIPNGMFECFLAALYLTVAGSGIYGLYITRVLPKRLTAISEEIIFERIPQFRAQIAGQAKLLALQCTGSSDVIPKFYLRKLLPFFERPRSLAYLVYPSGRRRRQLVRELKGLDRYLEKDQRSVNQQLTKFVHQKDDLDYHYAIQGRLKIWLFVHIGLTYGLLTAAVIHGIMAHAFGGGLR